jgi:hypothetical protein
VSGRTVVLVVFLSAALAAVTGGAYFLGKQMTAEEEPAAEANPPRSQRPEHVRSWDAPENGPRKTAGRR